MRKIYLFVAIATIGFVACNKSETALSECDTVKGTLQMQNAPPLDINEPSIINAARIVCNLSDNQEVAEMIFAAVKQTTQWGLDEEIRFRDILFPLDSKIISNPKEIDELTHLFKQAFGIPEEIERIQDARGFPWVDFILKTELHIYFPYSEDWKGWAGNIPPVVLPVREGMVENETTFAYLKVDEMKFDSILIDEDYATKFPVWIINKNETPYDNFPDFVNGQFEKDGNIWILPIYKEPTPTGTDPDKPDCKDSDHKNFTSERHIYEVRLGQIIQTAQLDDLWNGGSEMRYTYMGAKENATADGASINEEVTVCYDFTRKEIKNPNWVYVNAIINSDLEPAETQTQLTIWEDDGGGHNQVIPVKLKYKDYFESSFNLYIGDWDDIVYKLPMARVTYFGVNRINTGDGLDNNGFRVYGAGSGIYYTLPYTIVCKPY